MHEHLEDVLTSLIADELATTTRTSRAKMPMDIVARYVACTFVLVLNRWVESDAAWTPAETTRVFVLW